MADGSDFYLGRRVDPTNGELQPEKLEYDPSDLTTHGVVVGMTGSGKTGLCIDILEEAALNRIPVIMIDPKGDITNTLLHFPELRPEDFRPWIDTDEARREGRSPDEAAEATASLWRNGLAKWGIGPERIAAIDENVDFAVYTPGSDAGLPVSILASLEAPELAWEEHTELLREKISGTVTAILGLVGLRDIDPVRSREHILLANIFEHAWSQGKDLTLPDLIIQTQNPPFEKLGVFDVATFFPDRDRFALAMDLNNILAAPAFQSWIAGTPLNVGQILYTPEGRPRHSVFYIAHLSDEERMFFVTLLFGAIEGWMRTQAGSGSLRALVYFDEIFGYLPPTANPPSKEPMLRMLKQARAFGVGLLLASQNPVDVDYKALSNAGSWFVGKLGTDQDKQRLLDGLSTAMGGGMDRREYDDLISALGKRVFLLRNVHEKEPVLFQTRWAMNYLAGPITRARIPELNELAGVGTTPSGAHAPAVASRAVETPVEPEAPARAELPGNESRGAVPSSVEEFFLPVNLSLDEAAREGRRAIPIDAESRGILYRPVMLAELDIRYNNRKYDLDTDRRYGILVDEPDDRGRVEWGEYLTGPVDDRGLDRDAPPEARFAPLEPPLSDERALKSLRSELVDWAYRSLTLPVLAHEGLKLYAAPDDADDFARRLERAVEEGREEEREKLATQIERRLDSIEDKLRREQRELAEDQAEVDARKKEELGSHIETVLGFFTGRRRSVTTSMRKRRMTSKAQADVEESKEEIAEYEAQIEALEAELKEQLAEVDQRWEATAAEQTTIPVAPYKKDISLARYGVAWRPYHLVESDGRVIEVAAYRSPAVE